MAFYMTFSMQMVSKLHVHMATCGYLAKLQLCCKHATDASTSESRKLAPLLHQTFRDLLLSLIQIISWSCSLNAAGTAGVHLLQMTTQSAQPECPYRHQTNK